MTAPADVRSVETTGRKLEDEDGAKMGVDDHEESFSSLRDILQNLPQEAVGFRLFARPVQRQRWGDTQLKPHVDWGGLFFDLFFVAAAYNMGNIIRNSPTREGVLYFIATFWPIMFVWLDKLYYDSRFFVGDDVWHRVYEVLAFLTLGFAVSSIRTVDVLSHPSDYNEMFVFCLAITIGTLLTLFRYVEVFFFVEGEEVASRAGGRFALLKLVPLAFQVSATVIAGIEFWRDDDDDHDKYHHKDGHDDDDEHHDRMLAGGGGADADTYGPKSEANDLPAWLMIGGFVAEIIYVYIWIKCLPGGGAHKKYVVPMNIEFSIHRFGEWTMLMLGESILSLLIVEVNESSDFYLTFYCGILSVALLQYMHYRSQPHDADEHALRRSKEAGVVFNSLFQLYSACLVILGVSYKMLMYEFFFASSDDGHRRGRTRMLLPGFAADHHHHHRHPIQSRWLAGGDSGPPIADTAHRQQVVANFFCASMAIVFFCSDAMILLHKGLKDNVGRCYCKDRKKTKVLGVLLLFCRVGVIAFVGSLSTWETDPEHLALIGLGAVVFEIILRFLTSVVFPTDQVHVLDMPAQNPMDEMKRAMEAVIEMDEGSEEDEEELEE